MRKTFLMSAFLLATVGCKKDDLWRQRCENSVTLVASGAQHVGRCAPRETMELRPHDDGVLVVCTCPAGLITSGGGR